MPTPTFASRLRNASLDVGLTAVGVLLGLPSLLYPFGRDQGLYFYVAREWVLRGSVPYRDVLDHKTPGIYMLHALSILVFGANQWGIRVLDLIGLVAFAWLAGSLQVPAPSPSPRGARGGTVAVAALMFYGFADFWNTAQSELWYGGFGIVAIWAARRLQRLAHASLLAGLGAGAAMLMKPPAMWFVLVAMACLALRYRRDLVGWRSWAAMTARFALGAAALPGVVLAYFGAEHALFAMQDIVLGANAYYVKHEVPAPNLDWKDYAGTILTNYAPYTVLVPLGLLATWRCSARRSPERDAIVLGLAMLLAGVLAVVMQGKFYPLHWMVCAVPFAHLTMLSLRAMIARLPGGRGAAASAVLVGGCYVATAWIPHNHVARWRSQLAAVELRYALGQIGRSELDGYYTEPALGFSYAVSRQVGEWLREHTAPDDNVTVRGFQPEIYAIAERRHVGRFFWTTFITSDSRLYRRSEWRAEDLRDLQEHPPKYIVALSTIHDGPDSREWLAERLGYRTVAASMDGFTILSR